MENGMTHSPPCVKKCYINYLQFFCSRDLPLLFCLFIYLIVYLYHYRLMEIFCILWVNSQYCIIYFVASTSSLTVGGFFFFSAGPYFLLPYPPHCGFMFLRASFISGTTKHLRLILYVSCFSPGIKHSCKEIDSFYWTMVLESRTLSEQSTEEYVYVLSSVWTHTCKHSSVQSSVAL